MTSESTRKVIKQLNAAIEEANAELMALDSEARRSNNVCESNNYLIEDYRTSNWNQRAEINRKNKDYEFNMILMIFSLIFGFAAIGYAVWV